MAKHWLVLHVFIIIINTGSIRGKVIFSFFLHILILLIWWQRRSLLSLFELLVMKVVPIWGAAVNHLGSVIYFDFCCLLIHLFFIQDVVVALSLLLLLLFLSYFIKLFFIGYYSHTLCPFVVSVQILARLLFRERLERMMLLLRQRNLRVVHLF